MLGEFFAYHLGKSAGRNERTKSPRAIDAREMIYRRAVAFVILICALLVVLAKVGL